MVKKKKMGLECINNQQLAEATNTDNLIAKNRNTKGKGDQGTTINSNEQLGQTQNRLVLLDRFALLSDMLQEYESGRRGDFHGQSSTKYNVLVHKSDQT